MRSRLTGVRRQLDRLDAPADGCAHCPPLMFEQYADDEPVAHEPRPCLLGGPDRCSRRIAIISIEHLGVNRDGSSSLTPEPVEMQPVGDDDDATNYPDVGA
jgi:hypothetical protein